MAPKLLLLGTPMSARFAFYRYFAWPLNAINIFCGIALVGAPWTFMFWIKVVSNTVIILYFEIFQSNQFIFFYNAGLSKKALYMAVLTADSFLCVVVYLLCCLVLP